MAEDETAHLRRPDKAGYVIDTMPDFIRLTYNDDKQPNELAAIQIWCDPAQRDAWRDPELLKVIERKAEHQIVTIIRFGSRESISVFAPGISADGQWHEIAPHGYIEEVSPLEKIQRAARALKEEIKT